MYSAHSNGLGPIDGSGTINPSALNSIGLLQNPSCTITPDTSPRGIKRSCSPENYGDLPTDLGDGGGYSKPRKRGRPPKTRPPAPSESPNRPSLSISHNIPPTPKSQIANLPLRTPHNNQVYTSPARITPNKALVVKALPTVRDHTTDQLGAEGDEYIPREYDEAGEKKVDANGRLSDGREYKCRTFLVPNRGDKLFMLATECARVLCYRDSYLLFNKNRSLYKIIASQTEKEDLIRQGMLPYSYRSRQIAIVSARSMFRQFGSRVIRDGRRVRDDYWESKARKQGFTEEDLAGEKRPGAAKARDAAAASELSAPTTHLGPPHDILYSNNPAQTAVLPQFHSIQTGVVSTSGGLPPASMISLASEQTDLHIRDFSNIKRPRHEVTGPPYQDRIRTTPTSDLLSHANQAVDYNKQINQQRNRSFEFLHRRWRQPHVSTNINIAPRPNTAKEEPLSTQPQHNLRPAPGGLHTPSIQQATQHMIPSQSYPHASHNQNHIAPSPMRGMNVNSLQPGQLGRPPGIPINAANFPNANSYNYGQPGQTWNPQAQHSPQPFPQFASKSPHGQQSPHQATQLRHSGSGPQMPQMMQFPGSQNLASGYPNLGPNMYTADRGPQGFIQPNTSAAQASNQIWTGQQPAASGNNWAWNGPQ